MTIFMDRPAVTAIVPAYNEEQTIRSVAEALNRSPLIDRVLVISDGSTDRTEEEARSGGAEVHRTGVRTGKGAAMQRGVALTDSPIVLFVDADVKGLTVDHIDRLLQPVLNGALAMNVGLRDRGAVMFWVYRFLPLISGERAMKREVFLGVPPMFLAGYKVETALNYYCRSRGLRYSAVPLYGLTIRRKYEKVGWKKGMRQYLKMTVEVVRAMVHVRVARLFNRF